MATPFAACLYRFFVPLSRTATRKQMFDRAAGPYGLTDGSSVGLTAAEEGRILVGVRM